MAKNSNIVNETTRNNKGNIICKESKMGVFKEGVRTGEAYALREKKMILS